MQKKRQNILREHQKETVKSEGRKRTKKKMLRKLMITEQPSIFALSRELFFLYESFIKQAT